jgi:hypothetical protein
LRRRLLPPAHPLRRHPCTCHASRSLTALRAALPPHRELSRQQQDWILMCMQGGRACPLAACGVAPLCSSSCSSPLGALGSVRFRCETGEGEPGSGECDRATKRRTILADGADPARQSFGAASNAAMGFYRLRTRCVRASTLRLLGRGSSAPFRYRLSEEGSAKFGIS